MAGAHEAQMKASYNSEPVGYRLTITKVSEENGSWYGTLEKPDTTKVNVRGGLGFTKDKNGKKYTALEISSDDTNPFYWYFECYNSTADGINYYEEWHGRRAESKDDSFGATQFTFWRDMSEEGSAGWGAVSASTVAMAQANRYGQY